MKKVKVMLMSLLVVAAVGGALAFNAKTRGWSCSTDSTQGACTIAEPLSVKYKPALPGQDPVSGKFCTDNPGTQAPCVTVTVE